MHRFINTAVPVLIFLVVTTGAIAEPVTLAVANSTCSTIRQVAERFRENHTIDIVYVCKSSGRLAKGLRGGAIQADIYISANRHWMDYMINGGLVGADTVTSPWGNRLVVSVPVNSALRMTSWNELNSDRIKTILIGDPGTAPFGRYTKQALQKTGIWEQVKHKITTKKHITLLAETLATSDHRTVGILFSTNLSSKLRTIYPVDPDWHPSIRYFLAPVSAAADRSEVQRLLAFILGREGREIFSEAGFHVTPP